MDPVPPRPPLLFPDTHCFRCGEGWPPAAELCPACGASRTLDTSEERGHIAYLVRALATAAQDGTLTPLHADRVAHRFRRHAGWTAPAPVASARRAPLPPPPPRPPVNMTVVWANGLLYIGAFFVVMTAVLFLLALGGLGRTILSAAVAVTFLAGGLVCRRIEIVRSAGTVFLATGALVLPLVFVAFATYIEGGGPLAPRLIWLVAAVACLIVYASMTVLGLGYFYAVLSLIATSNAFLALFSAAQWDDRWYPTLFGVQALLLIAVNEIGGDGLRRLFGPLVWIWGLLWAAPTVVGWAIVSFASTPGAAIPPVLLLIAIAWLLEWRHPNPVSPAAAGALQMALVAQLLRLADAPLWSIGLALTLVAGAYVAVGYVWRASLAGRELFVLGIAGALVGSAPPFFAGHHGPGALAGLLATAVLVAGAVLVRHSLVLVPAGWTLAVGWYFVVALFAAGEASRHGLGLAYLPLVALAAIAALALRLEWTQWRWTLAAITAAYAALTVALTFDRASALSPCLAVLTVVGVAFAARWDAPWLVAVPAASASALILSLLSWLDAPPALLGPSVLTLGLALWTAGLVVAGRYSPAFRLCGAAVSGLAFLTGLVNQLADTGASPRWTAHLDSLILLAIAVWTAWESRTRHLLVYLASLIAMAALLWELEALGVRNLQAYAVPLGLYLIGVGIAAARDALLPEDGGPLAATAWTLAGVAFCLPTLLQSFGSAPVRYALVLLAESFLLIVLGLAVKRRGLLAAATTFTVIAGLRMVFQNPDLILPAFAAASCTFFSVGLGVLIVHGIRRKRAAAEAGPPAEP